MTLKMLPKITKFALEKKLLYELTHPRSFVFLNFLGTEIAGGEDAPSRARNSQTLSSVRVNPRGAGGHKVAPHYVLFNISEA